MPTTSFSLSPRLSRLPPPPFFGLLLCQCREQEAKTGGGEEGRKEGRKKERRRVDIRFPDKGREERAKQRRGRKEFELGLRIQIDSPKRRGEHGGAKGGKEGQNFKSPSPSPFFKGECGGGRSGGPGDVKETLLLSSQVGALEKDEKEGRRRKGRDVVFCRGEMADKTC